eukprot:scaffold42967_cov176-Amphora_coffeaeformis.AAC.2
MQRTLPVHPRPSLPSCAAKRWSTLCWIASSVSIPNCMLSWMSMPMFRRRHRRGARGIRKVSQREMLRVFPKNASTFTSFEKLALPVQSIRLELATDDAITLKPRNTDVLQINSLSPILLTAHHHQQLYPPCGSVRLKPLSIIMTTQQQKA